MHRPRLPVFARLVLFPLPVFLLAQVPAATATLWRVPEDLPHIQDAIAAAEDGDQVVVSPGTYHEVLDFLGKDIRVSAPAGPMVTTLTGAGLGESPRPAASTDSPSLRAKGLHFGWFRSNWSTCSGPGF